MGGSPKLVSEYLNNQGLTSNDKVEIMLAPGALYCKEIAKTYKCLAQDVSYLAPENVAATGELSCQQYLSAGVKASLVGHSECRARRDHEVMLKSKLSNLINAQMQVVYCIGEKQVSRNTGQTFAVLTAQLQNIKTFKPDNLIIAYEPVWSIGTGKVPSTKQITEVMEFVNDQLFQYGYSVTKMPSVCYGGSVNADNIAKISQIDGCSGVLVGRASLDISMVKNMISKV